MVLISNKIDDYDLGVVSTLGGLWEPGSGEIQVFPPFWEIKEDDLGKNAFQLRSEEGVGNNILQCGMWGKENIAGRRHSLSKGWKVRKHAVFGNVKFSKVHTMSILHILLVNTLNGNVCFDTGLC